MNRNTSHIPPFLRLQTLPFINYNSYSRDHANVQQRKTDATTRKFTYKGNMIFPGRTISGTHT